MHGQSTEKGIRLPLFKAAVFMITILDFPKIEHCIYCIAPKRLYHAGL